MNPYAIQNLLYEAKLLHDDAVNSAIYTVPAFLSSWVAWEALRTRFIRVVIHHQGWLLKDADRVLAKKRISSMSAAEKVILNLGLKHPHQWSSKSATGWKTLVEIEPLRHRLIHGFKSIDPGRVQAATKVVICLVSNHAWLSTVPIANTSESEGKNRIVGPLLQPKRSSRKTHNRCIQDLAETIHVELNKGTKPLPSLAHLEDLLKDFNLSQK